jgi:drug/metabolite transporter (DMT)-like permease
MITRAGVLQAMLAALLFGASVPLAKLLLGQVAPLVLAGLLYLGSGAGLGAWYGIRCLRHTHDGAELGRTDLVWLAGAIAAGGIAGPILLMTGLAATPASAASLLLNLEGVLTALLAWFVFYEQYDRRIILGMLCIVIASGLLSWQPGDIGMTAVRGPLCVAAACLCWAIDNNLTRKVAASDAVQIACLKGLVAGMVNLGLAWWLGLPLPPAGNAAVAVLLGFCGYGVSLVLFVLALRHLGSARTGAYFSLAPFAGAALALLIFGNEAGFRFWVAAPLMAVGIWLHLSERHSHRHAHHAQDHAHRHRHDEHHQHVHSFEWDGSEPHTHAHHHAPLEHAHPHMPDIHHQHRH